MAVVSNGTTLIDNGALGASAGAGKLTLIKTLTASSSATLSFVHGASSVIFDGTYDSYIFKFIDIHPASNDVNFQFNMSTDGGSNYNVTKTTTFFKGFHTEGGGGGEVTYDTGRDLAQSTSDAKITREIGNQNDDSTAGTLLLFSPASTTFVKHFISRTQDSSSGSSAFDNFSAGYGNTTSAVDAVRFSFSSGSFDGIIKMYGVGG